MVQVTRWYSFLFESGHISTRTALVLELVWLRTALWAAIFNHCFVLSEELCLLLYRNKRLSHRLCESLLGETKL